MGKRVTGLRLTVRLFQEIPFEDFLSELSVKFESEVLKFKFDKI